MSLFIVEFMFVYLCICMFLTTCPFDTSLRSHWPSYFGFLKPGKPVSTWTPFTCFFGLECSSPDLPRTVSFPSFRKAFPDRSLVVCYPLCQCCSKVPWFAATVPSWGRTFHYSCIFPRLALGSKFKVVVPVKQSLCQYIKWLLNYQLPE